MNAGPVMTIRGADFGLKKMLALSVLFHVGAAALILAVALSRSTHRLGAHVYQVDLVTLPPAPAAPPAPVRETSPPAAPPRAEVKKPAITPPPKTIRPSAKIPPPAKPKQAPPPKEAAPTPPSGAKPSDNVSAVAPATKLETGIEVPDFKFPYYTENIRRKIEMSWSPPPMESTAQLKEAVVGFVLYPNGKIGDPRIEKSSGNAFFDQAALRAVYQANPLPPFPQGLREVSLTIHFSFTLMKKS